MDYLTFLAAPFLASLILTGIHAYLGVHVVERGVIFVDLSLAQIAALGASVAILYGADPHASTAYWVSLGLPLAQVSLSYGVDDLHGTILEEKIFHMAGATTPQQQSVAALEHAIREAGREPVQRDSHYRHISPRQPTKTRARSAPAELACA